MARLNKTKYPKTTLQNKLIVFKVYSTSNVD